MKLLSILPVAFLSKKAYANVFEMQVAMELQECLGDSVEQRIEVLNRLARKYKTSDEYGCAEVLRVVGNVTKCAFSTTVYDHCEVPEANRRTVDESDSNAIRPRFMVAQADLQMVGGIDEVLGGYGCWCRFSPEKQHVRGKGQAKDHIDQLCKNLQLSYECLRMDIFEAEEKWCDPATTTYHYDMTAFMMSGLIDPSVPSIPISDDCETKNAGDECAIKTCILELTLIHDYIKTATGTNAFGADFDNRAKIDYMHLKLDGDGNKISAGEFDPSIECQHVPTLPDAIGGDGSYNGANDGADKGVNNEQVIKGCCGTFPKRYPYNRVSSNRGCCNGKTYYKHFTECCIDDTTNFEFTTPVGTCDPGNVKDERRDALEGN